MSGKKCHACEGSGSKYSWELSAMVVCKTCNGTGTIEPKTFWTKRAPTKPGRYFVVYNNDSIDLVHFRTDKLVSVDGIPASYRIDIISRDIKYWSTDPIEFPALPEEG